jgi:hypothetical protein
MRNVFDSLHAHQLRQCVKMRVAGAQDKRMLQHEGGDPHIVCGDGSALLAQLSIKSSVVMGCLIVGVEHADAGLQQKAAQAQDSFVPSSKGIP